MRAREFLLEYETGKTVANYGDALLKKVSGDHSIVADDIQEKIAKLNADTYATAIPALKNEIVQYFEQFDPTNKKAFTVWLIKSYLSGGIQRLEDLSRAHTYLEEYIKITSSGLFRRDGGKAANYGRIDNFAKLSDLGSFVNSLSAQEMLPANQQELQSYFTSGQATLVADTPEMRVVIPHTEAASCYFGRNTQWCTASTMGANHFKGYASRGALYIVLDKANNRRWQLHFEDGQFMDENDEPITNWDDFPMEFFDYVDVTKLQEVVKLSLLADDDMGTLPAEIFVRLIESVSLGSLIFTMMRGGGVYADEYLDLLYNRIDKYPGLPQPRRVELNEGYADVYEGAAVARLLCKMVIDKTIRRAAMRSMDSFSAASNFRVADKDSCDIILKLFPYGVHFNRRGGAQIFALRTPHSTHHYDSVEFSRDSTGTPVGIPRVIGDVVWGHDAGGALKHLEDYSDDFKRAVGLEWAKEVLTVLVDEDRKLR